MVMITKELLFELPDVLSEPTIIKNFFTDEMFERVQKAVRDTGMGTDKTQFHTMLARWEAPIQFDPDIEQHCIEQARKIFNEPELKKAYFYAVRYQRKDGCIPHLWEHTGDRRCGKGDLHPVRRGHDRHRHADPHGQHHLHGRVRPGRGQRQRHRRDGL